MEISTIMTADCQLLPLSSLPPLSPSEYYVTLLIFSNCRCDRYRLLPQQEKERTGKRNGMELQYNWQKHRAHLEGHQESISMIYL